MVSYFRSPPHSQFSSSQLWSLKPLQVTYPKAEHIEGRGALLSGHSSPVASSPVYTDLTYEIFPFLGGRAEGLRLKEQVISQATQ